MGGRIDEFGVAGIGAVGVKKGCFYESILVAANQVAKLQSDRRCSISLFGKSLRVKMACLWQCLNFRPLPQKHKLCLFGKA